MKTILPALLTCLVLVSDGRDYVATVLDEDNHPLDAAVISALFTRKDDPRYSGMRTFEGTTDTRGVFRFSAGDDMCLVRLRASKSGHYEADVETAHGLGRIPSELTHTVVLPRLSEGVPLCYKDVVFRRLAGTLPPRTWVGFDLALGDVIRPWGKGETADISFWNEGERIGWMAPDEMIEEYRHDQNHAGFSTEKFESMYGSFRGVTRIRGEAPGSGIMRSTAFWPYCRLKMPPLAPLEGYATQLELPYATASYPTPQDEFVGYFLRVRAKLGPDGRVISAHYAKIQRAFRHGFGTIGFRYYYNPTPDDRRLVHDMKTNLLQPGPDTPGPDLDRYRSYEP